MIPEYQLNISAVEVAQPFLDALPEKIRLGLVTCAAQIAYPVEAVLEIAIAGFCGKLAHRKSSQ